MLHPTKNFGSVYRKLLGDLLNKDHAIVETNKRTKTQVAVLPGAQAFQLSLEDGLLPLNGLRRTYPRTAAAEVAWFLKGARDVEWLEEREVRIWSPFVGTGNHEGLVENAYGYRWRSHFDRDQIADAVETLQGDPSSRQVYVSAWDPARDGLGRRNKNFPCPVGFTFSILNNQLHSTLLLRSSDVFVGLPYDVMGHAMLMAIVAGWIDSRLTLGTMTVTLAHVHMYADHWDMAKDCLSRTIQVNPKIQLVQIKQDRPDWDYFISQYEQQCLRKKWPELNPRPRLVV